MVMVLKSKRIFLVYISPRLLSEDDRHAEDLPQLRHVLQQLCPAQP